MTGAPQNDALLIMWLAFTGAAALGVIAVLVWAVRSRQFTGQDRARYLPLRSGIPPEPGRPPGRGREGRDAEPGRHDDGSKPPKEEVGHVQA